MSEIKCKICGAVENSEKWVEETRKELEESGLCFNCNFWHGQYLRDKEMGEYDVAIVNGEHYRLLPEDPNAYFKGHGGRGFIFKFHDGAVRQCHNVWFQGIIPEGHFRELMPDNAEIIGFENQ